MKSSRNKFSYIHSDYQAQKRIKAEVKLTVRTAILISI
jgi:hypothetical protein